VVVSNPAGVGRGLVDRQAVDDIHARMLAAVEAAGGRIEAVLYCPHTVEDDCDCRKPRPGLLYRASRELDVDLADSAFVGDNITDIQAAVAAGCRPVLVLTGRGTASRAPVAGSPELGDVAVVDDLLAAVGLLLDRGDCRAAAT
jgi:D-glycero-D-manno-heptose 1,7-bisphosphate phosphatase